MDRIFTISLSISFAAHLAVGGLASHYDQHNDSVDAPLSITLNPVTVASSKPTATQLPPALSEAVDVTETSDTFEAAVVSERPSQTATAKRQQAQQQIAAANTQSHHPQPIALHQQTDTSLVQTDTQSADDVKTRQQLQQGLHRLFNTHFYYPRLAQRRGIEGIVHIGLHVSADGEVTDIHLFKGSGADILDHAALKSAQEITVYPDATELLRGKPLDMVMPVKFQLTNS